MLLQRIPHPGAPAKSTGLPVALYLIVIALTSNLNAIVDFFLHPEIHYFDEEHLIVGGVTGCVYAVLFFALHKYMRFLSSAREQIKVIESILPVCASCKRIRKPDSDPARMDSWQPMESYLMERTHSELSHGICPECASKLYREYV